jgi:hypothetical protein
MGSYNAGTTFPDPNNSSTSLTTCWALFGSLPIHQLTLDDELDDGLTERSSPIQADDRGALK